MIINKLKTIIHQSKVIYLASHLNPDGDNLGSLLALYHILKLENKDVFVIEDDEIPDNLKFLPGLNDMTKSYELKEEPDLFITLDSADLDRIGEDAKKLFESAKYTINIDHHSTNMVYADLNIVDGLAAATGEILFGLFKELNYKLSKNIATCLYTSISSDTGSFKYDSVTSKTFEIAAELLSYDIDFNTINVNLYENKSLEKTKLLIKVMDYLELFCDNKIGIATVTENDIKETNAKKSDSDGIVEFIRDIDTVEIAILLKESGEDTRVSLRSKKYINVSKIAEKFGGGGHVRAAGATIHLPIEEAKKDILKKAIEEIQK